MSLFEFKSENQIDQYGADSIKLVKSQHVNVVTDYAWTVQPKTSRVDVPYLFMIERKITNDVVLQQILYNLTSAVELGQQTVTEFYKKLEDSIETESTKNKDGDEKKENKPKSEPKLVESSNDFKQGFNTLNDKENPYAGLYSLEDTGWSYVLPYFSPSNHSITGNWGTPSEGGDMFSSIGSTISSSLATTAATVNKVVSALGAGVGSSESVRVGTYIESAKQYNFEAQGPSYSLNFNLYNTGKIQDVIDNWELCFAFMYNLLPNRKTKTIFDPPPLYEIHIPGVRRSPVSFIKGMQVDFLGSTRLMDLDVAGQSGLRTIVPDAYSISIDIEDVLPESKNFMQSMVDDTKRVRVTTSTEGRSVSESFQQAQSEYNNITRISL